MSGEPTPAPGAEGRADATRTVNVAGDAATILIDSYKIVRQLGEGGMGVVYYAQQLQPIRRDVALKVIKPGMDSKQVIARFEGERQALAMMDHPNIARVFDAGTTAAGLPYFAMELVDGIPITRYCDSKRLTVRDRIELFIPVCQAIQHAHQKGVIHRDIKPSNILVKQQENRAEPKVIDFGLAKALGQQMSDVTMTVAGFVVGTVQYMSPEQAELGRHDIDTRSDIYSLGAVFYELLTGMTPLESGRLANATFIEALQYIRDGETKTPSSRLRRSGELKELAALRGSDPARLPKLLDRELDWIAMKALEKDRARRYETVNGLALDLRRYLQGEPVEAAPPSAAYRAGKLLRKHRAWLVTAGAFIAVLIAGAVVSVWMAVRESRAEAATRAVNEFLQKDLLAQASAFNQARADTKPDPNLTVRTALDRAAARIEGKFATQPLVEASIRQTIGSAYIDLGLFQEAERQVERALSLRRRELGEKHADTMASMSSLAAAYERHGKLKEAEPLYVKVLDSERRQLGDDDPITLGTMNGLAVTYGREGEFLKSEAIYKRLVPMEQRVLGEENFQTLRSMGNLAATYDLLKKYDLAEPLYVKTLELKRRVLGDENPETLDTITNLGELYCERGEYRKAEPLFADALRTYRRVLGDSHASTINAMNALADLYRNVGDNARAEKLFTEALDASHRGPGDEHPVTLETMTGLAQTYASEGRYPEADALFTKIVDTRRRVLGADHPDTLESLVWLGSIRLKRGQYSEAETLLRRTLESYQKTAPEEWERHNCESLIGASLAGQKKYAEAEPLLIAGYQGMLQARGVMADQKSALAEAGPRIVNLYEHWGKPAAAAEWRSKVQ
jgi:non-specific serine/threonine protein kinase/serine/threonine-protein kinase